MDVVKINWTPRSQQCKQILELALRGSGPSAQAYPVVAYVKKLLGFLIRAQQVTLCPMCMDSTAVLYMKMAVRLLPIQMA